jgi:hypothetical protein
MELRGVRGVKTRAAPRFHVKLQFTDLME